MGDYFIMLVRQKAPPSVGDTIFRAMHSGLWKSGENEHERAFFYSWFSAVGCDYEQLVLLPWP